MNIFNRGKKSGKSDKKAPHSAAPEQPGPAAEQPVHHQESQAADRPDEKDKPQSDQSTGPYADNDEETHTDAERSQDRPAPVEETGRQPSFDASDFDDDDPENKTDRIDRPTEFDEDQSGKHDMADLRAEAQDFQEEAPPRMLLEIKNLSVRLKSKYTYVHEEYGKSHVLHPLNIEVFSNSFVAVVGESGSGKSLLSKVLFRLLPESDWEVSGIINYDGQPILKGYQYQPELRRILHQHVAAIFQEPTSYFNPAMRIWQQITERNVDDPTLKAEYYDLNQKLIQVHILKQNSNMGMEYLSRYPHQFSQGQQQRLMWTMTLYDFQLLIADEPTASLDTTIQKEIVDLLIQRRRNNEISSMLLFTHDLRLVKALLTEEQDRIYFLEPHESGGYGIRQMYTPRELFHSEHEDLSRFVQKKISISRSLGFKREPQSAESSGEVHLEIRNLKQGYKHGIMGKTKTVLHIPDLVIKRGEIVGLVGESGCGKSTFARAVVRLLNHTDSDSEIVFYPIKDHEAGPFDLVQLQPNAYKDNKQMRHLRSRIQIIFQDAATAFNPEMTIEETFNETFRLYRYRDKSRILRNYLQALRLAKTNIEIEKILASYPSEMSAGQRQRLTLIRALLARPEFLILDEPFTNVDRETTQDMLKVIKTIQKDRTMTCIMISHDLSLVMEVCDRVIVMEAGSDGIGREHQSGKPEELFANPRPYTKKLLQSILRV